MTWCYLFVMDSNTESLGQWRVMTGADKMMLYSVSMSAIGNKAHMNCTFLVV